jgi:hypothetical protein
VKLAAVALVAIAGTASADTAARVAEPPPDPAAMRAGEANLEPITHRKGFTVAMSIAPELTIGNGDVGSNTGGIVVLRLGQVASPSSVVYLELAGAGQLHKVGDRLEQNTHTGLFVGAQYWAGSLWVRGGLGLGVYRGNDVPMAGHNIRHVGPGSSVSVGVDLVRMKSVVLDFEVFAVGMLYRHGIISTNGLGLGLSFD